jgi:hypothetical protein
MGRHLQGSVPASLKEVLAAADPVKKRQVLQNLSQHIIPIMEKGLVDSMLSHRCVPQSLMAALQLETILINCQAHAKRG